MKRPGQANMECPGCGKHAEMREWYTYWLAPKEWVPVRGRYYCKACIDAFEGKTSEG